MSNRNRKISRLQKAEFVGNDLHIRLRRLYDNKILNTYYQEIDGKETVSVLFKSGDKVVVDVTGLIKTQIAEKVFNVLRKRTAERN